MFEKNLKQKWRKKCEKIGKKKDFFFWKIFFDKIILKN